MKKESKTVWLKDTRLNKGALKRLETLNIKTLEDLKQIGSVGAFLKMKAFFTDQVIPKCYNLYDLEALLMGKEKGWKSMTPLEKAKVDEKLKEK